jgi:molybdenum cofactor cytidylyltransferase
MTQRNGRSTGAVAGTAQIVGVLLAAGAGTRFGGAKLLAPLPAAAHGVAAGTPIGVAACRHLIAALPNVIAVVRSGDVELAERLRETGAATIVCERAHEGMGASLASAIAATADARGWVVALADMPWIAPATIDAVAARVRSGASLVAPLYRGQRGHPVGFAASHFASLASLRGDEGAKGVIAQHAAALETFEVDDPGVLLDVDRRPDLTKTGSG